MPRAWILARDLAVELPRLRLEFRLRATREDLRAPQLAFRRASIA
jgi:hypothetical protein